MNKLGDGTGERWLPIRNYPAYEVSDQGRVRHGERLMKVSPMPSTKRNPVGYMRVELCKDGIKKTCYVHRLVAEAFIPNPAGLPEVDHRDVKAKHDNSISNLEWVTELENARRAALAGLRYGGRLLPKAGVSRRGTKWIAYIGSHPQRHLGTFSTEKEARAARTEAVRKEEKLMSEVVVHRIIERDGTPVALRPEVGELIPRHADCLRYDAGFCNPKQVDEAVFPVFKSKKGKSPLDLTRRRWTSFGLVIEKLDEGEEVVRDIGGWTTYRHKDENPLLELEPVSLDEWLNRHPDERVVAWR